MNDKQKIDTIIFGGAFDPVHKGHLMIAKRVERFSNSVTFVPCLIGPFDKHPQASAEDRINMLKLAIKEQPNFHISDIEINRPGKSYTIDTINHYVQQGYKHIGLLIGYDALLSFDKWKDVESIINKVTLFIVHRPGVTSQQVQEVLRKPLFSKARYHLIEEPNLSVSSTQTKIYSFLNEDLTSFTPKEVADYIKEKHIYQREEVPHHQQQERNETTMTDITPNIVHEHGLTDEEYKKIQKLLGRKPNITELGMFSVLWSEHCSYKNSKPLLKLFPTTSKRVLQGPGENSGIIDIDDGVALSFKIESHNHPSAIEPYQGAATGAGGIIRDIFSMGARPIVCCDSLRFGDIRTDQQSRHLFEEVVRGIGDYGNCVGIPTVAGEVYFEDSYADNCLVNAMCLGVVQSAEKLISPLYGPSVRGIASGAGNIILYVGASTGRDGIHGATFASVELTDESTDKKSSVQVGDPFQEKLLVEACLELLKSGCVIGMGDMGAAGLTSSLSEMATRGGHGIEIDINRVPQREKGMSAYEIMLSESQERMVVVVDKDQVDTAFDIIKKWDLHGVAIGKVTSDHRFRVLNKDVVEADLPSTALTDDAPVYVRKGRKPDYLKQTSVLNLDQLPDLQTSEVHEVLLKLLSAPNIASKQWVYEQYDHMVQTNTNVYPGKADAAVILIKNTDKRIAVKTDGNGRHCYLSPFIGGKSVVAEAARNVACTGATPLAITNCLNFGNPEKPQSYWQLQKAIEGMTEACKAFDTPVISGNVSLYNESENGAIYPTPVVGMVGLFEHDSSPMSSSFKAHGDLIFCVGQTKNNLGGSEYLKTHHGMVKGVPDDIDLEVERRLQQKTVEAVKQRLVESAHDCSDGGLLVAVSECLIDTDLGAQLTLTRPDKIRIDSLLYGETQSRIIFSVKPKNRKAFEGLFHELGVTLIGEVKSSPALNVKINGKKVFESKTQQLKEAYMEAIPSIMKH